MVGKWHSDTKCVLVVSSAFDACIPSPSLLNDRGPFDRGRREDEVGGNSCAIRKLVWSKIPRKKNWTDGGNECMCSPLHLPDVPLPVYCIRTGLILPEKAKLHNFTFKIQSQIPYQAHFQVRGPLSDEHRLHCRCVLVVYTRKLSWLVRKFGTNPMQQCIFMNEDSNVASPFGFKTPSHKNG